MLLVYENLFYLAASPGFVGGFAFDFTVDVGMKSGMKLAKGLAEAVLELAGFVTSFGFPFFNGKDDDNFVERILLKRELSEGALQEFEGLFVGGDDDDVAEFVPTRYFLDL